jgi:hypothetical protein
MRGARGEGERDACRWTRTPCPAQRTNWIAAVRGDLDSMHASCPVQLFLRIKTTSQPGQYKLACHTVITCRCRCPTVRRSCPMVVSDFRVSGLGFRV